MIPPLAFLTKTCRKREISTDCSLEKVDITTVNAFEMRNPYETGNQIVDRIWARNIISARVYVA